ncbi:unnamed protein product [Heligmosomoides polygyrus]|uniref:Uncharacterized protein n=1 Tax=Heligmosomoides polygyrus TaxID=6339 RepID=A0A183GB47_HELPZ|nr:unnamed protein product [Heligmosomoides polygyrus]
MISTPNNPLGRFGRKTLFDPFSTSGVLTSYTSPTIYFTSNSQIRVYFQLYATINPDTTEAVMKNIRGIPFLIQVS